MMLSKNQSKFKVWYYGKLNKFLDWILKEMREDDEIDSYEYRKIKAEIDKTRALMK